MPKIDPIILAIETSCDDTSASVTKGRKLLSLKTISQSDHKDYGGVVPELASRLHQQNIVSVVDSALKEACISQEGLNSIAFTRGPGLLGSLLVGTCFAKSMALALGLPLIEVNHLQAHVMSLFVDGDNDPKFPFLCLLVSGGNTMLIKVTDSLTMEVIGETLDDAIGEAFDKACKLMNLSYPGGPIIDKFAKRGRAIFDFPEPKVPDLNFSFSGIKTFLYYFLKKGIRKDLYFIDNEIFNICASYQAALVRIVINKLKAAIELTNITNIGVVGGVSANSLLRSELEDLAYKYNLVLSIPNLEYFTDNAAMVAVTAYFKYMNTQFIDPSVSPIANYTN
ncbi:MAG: tRNA (adenosine(37)-N6)-threonylcarbamoyltransferase complex transferase subunit TsaD [Solitalea-like symbiont of Acarus siro]